MKATYQKILCLTLIVSLTLNACENQAGSGASGNTSFSRNNLLNLKGNVRLTNPDYREDIFELNDVAVFDESGVGGGVFYIDSTKGLQILAGVKLPPEILKSNVKFVEFMKSEKDNFQPIATNYPKPDNSLAMHYDAVHGALHWVSLTADKSKWQEYSIDVTKSPQLISLLQESVIDPNVSRENLAVSFRDNEADGETMVDVTYAESNIATDLDGQPVAGAMRVSYLAKTNNIVNNKSLLVLENEGAKFVEARGYFENTYIYSNSTSKAEENFIHRLYPNAEVGKLTEHRVTFFDGFRLSLPALAIIIACSVVGGAIGLIKRWKSPRLEEFKQETKAMEQDLSQIKNEQDAKSNSNNMQVNTELANKEKGLILGISNPHSLALEKGAPISGIEKVEFNSSSDSTGELSLKDGSFIMKMPFEAKAGEEIVVVIQGRLGLRQAKISMPAYSELKNVKTMKDVYNIMLKYNDEFGAFNDSEIFLFRKKLSEQPHLEVNVKTVYKNYADFINPRTKKRWPLLGAAIGSATSAGLLINDTYSQVANFIWGGCGNFTCSSAYFYGDKSESVVSIKADALYQQVAFNDSKVNYKLNVVQVFSQTCIEMIRNSAESNLAILYAKTGERHYLISDVNNKLCPIGDMDMSKFIESVGATQ